MVLLNSKRKSKKGFSLLELLLVLGIIAALVVAAFIVY
ncbi:prepilin-type N-terminal cleavage/methylation domain-containing protein, partial [Salmonella enterica]|nr:prepilin-type N-terminal cleavage/methylation domain-containing protein [Salmonella enterica]HAC7959670.1 prepilin-type N-terminal cleavage/methylation domain-containing protein [Salmonella enterica subsp. enterica serovar Enteritidis]